MKTGEIVNRVANSVLVTIDLEEYYPSGERILFDIKDWLYEGLVLREKSLGRLSMLMIGLSTKTNI